MGKEKKHKHFWDCDWAHSEVQEREYSDYYKKKLEKDNNYYLLVCLICGKRKPSKKPAHILNPRINDIDEIELAKIRDKAKKRKIINPQQGE